MIVVEVVDDAGLPSHTVVEVLRSGYLWRGRVLRYAEVQRADARPGRRRPRGNRWRGRRRIGRGSWLRTGSGDDGGRARLAGNGLSGDCHHGHHRRHRPGNDQQRGRRHPGRPTRRPGRGRRSDPPLGRRPRSAGPPARRQGRPETSSCSPRSGPSARSSARWVRKSRSPWATRSTPPRRSRPSSSGRSSTAPRRRWDIPSRRP